MYAVMYAVMPGDILSEKKAKCKTAYILCHSFCIKKEEIRKYTDICLLLQNKHRSSVQSLSGVQLFATPWIAAQQASLSITNSQSLLKLMSIESVMPSNHLILCYPLLLPSVFPSIRVFSNESVLLMRWPKYWECQLQHQSFQ